MQKKKSMIPVLATMLERQAHIVGDDDLVVPAKAFEALMGCLNALFYGLSYGVPGTSAHEIADMLWGMEEELWTGMGMEPSEEDNWRENLDEMTLNTCRQTLNKMFPQMAVAFGAYAGRQDALKEFFRLGNEEAVRDALIDTHRLNQRDPFFIAARHAFLGIPVESPEAPIEENLVARLCAQPYVAYVMVEEIEDEDYKAKASVLFDGDADNPGKIGKPGEWRDYLGPTPETALARALYAFWQDTGSLPNGRWSNEEWGSVEDHWKFFPPDNSLASDPCPYCEEGGLDKWTDYLDFELGNKPARMIREQVSCDDCKFEHTTIVRVAYLTEKEE
jgi:hypothetical protein